MKSTATYQEIERGILNSSYKQEIRESIQDFHAKSISKIKARFLHQHDKIQSQTAAILQVSFVAFVVILVLI